MTLLPPTAPHPYLSPRQLQVASYLYGLNTPNLDTATVLELGCNQGQNLLAFAYSHPLAKAIGIDLDPETISQGQQQLKNKGITNIELHALDLAQLVQTELPLCDYIIIRGLFAQIDLETRLQLLNHCRQFLHPNGVIVMQYAVYPGSKAVDGIFDSLALHSAHSDTSDSEQQLTALRAMLGFMAEGMSQDSASTKAIQTAIKQLEQQSDENLYLSALGGLHHPCYFIEFASQLDAAGLCYVGDADPASELPERLGNKAHTLTRLINPSQNKILTQQYVDTLSNRSHRYSLLSHSSQASQISVLPDVKKVIDLHWAGYFQPINHQGQLQNNLFDTKATKLVKTNHTISQDALYALGAAWPYSLNFKTIARHAAPLTDLLENIDAPTAHQQVAKALEQIFIHFSEYLYLSKQSGPYNALPYKKVSSPPLAMLYDGSGSTPIYVTLWNEQVTLENPKSLEVLSDNLSIDTPAAIEQVMALRKQGLVFANHKGWEHFYLDAYQFINTQEQLDSSLYLAHLLNFSYYHTLFENKTATLKSTIELSNKKEKILQKNQNKPEEILIKSLKKAAFSNEEIAHALLILVDEKMKLSNLYAINQSIELDPKNYSGYLAITRFMNSHDKNKLQLSYWLSRKLFILANKNSYLLTNFAIIYNEKNQLAESEKIRYLIKKSTPSNLSNINNLALVLSAQGKTENALDEYEDIINSLDFISYSNYLFIALHSSRYTPEKLFALHKAYGERVEKWAAQQKWQSKPFTKKPSNTPLRIGFVSGDLYNHAVTKFLLPYWEGIDTSRFHIYAYYTNDVSDGITERLKEKATKWTDSYSLNYLDLAQVIRDDDIDILIDLSGHTGHNSLPTFALKPAPVQMTWIGYPATTGLKAMDYIFANDFYYNNKDFTWQFTEKFLCLKSTSSIFDHGVNLPPRTDYIPVKINNHFTFASFNRPQKISSKVLETWAKIMISCPGDKLLLANMPDDETITTFKEKMVSFGAKESQLIFKKRCGLYDYLNLHNEVDLLLDTFPYAGGTTSVHAISMGLATIYLKGKTMASNPLIYNRYNLSDFGANNIKEYIEKAIYHSKDHERLQKLRENLKLKSNNGKRSPVELFEKSLEYVWENYCLGNPARSTIIN